MKPIKLLLTDEDLENINGGMIIEKRVRINEKDIIVMNVACTGGKDDSGGNGKILGGSNSGYAGN